MLEIRDFLSRASEETRRGGGSRPEHARMKPRDFWIRVQQL